jgi:hypothetical protein
MYTKDVSTDDTVIDINEIVKKKVLLKKVISYQLSSNAN